jgi:hypothetical protein
MSAVVAVVAAGAAHHLIQDTGEGSLLALPMLALLALMCIGLVGMIVWSCLFISSTTDEDK